MADVRQLITVLERLVDCGQHGARRGAPNLDVVKRADWVIDLGPEGAEEAGEIVAEGTPEQVAKAKSRIPARRSCRARSRQGPW